MGRKFKGLRGVLARRSQATSGGESIGGAGPHLQRLGVGANRRTDVSSLSLQIFVNRASSPSVTPPHVYLGVGALAPSLARALARSFARAVANAATISKVKSLPVCALYSARPAFANAFTRDARVTPSANT